MYYVWSFIKNYSNNERLNPSKASFSEFVLPPRMVRIENRKSGLTRRIQILFIGIFSRVVESDYQTHVTGISNDNNYYNYKFTFYTIRAWDTLEIVREEIIVQLVARYTYCHTRARTVFVTIVD